MRTPSNILTYALAVCENWLGEYRRGGSIPPYATDWAQKQFDRLTKLPVEQIAKLNSHEMEELAQKINQIRKVT